MAWPSGWRVRHVDETASTNTDLLDEVAAGDAGPGSVLVADHQTAGRGRLDRRWEAPAGANLLVSLALGPVPEVPAEITQRVGVAALHASRRLLGPDAMLGLKWPNDLLLDGRKLAGILAQRSSSEDVVVVGLGLNVQWAPDGAAALVDATPADGSTRSAASPSPHPAEVLHGVLEALDALASVGNDERAEAYRRELITLGQEVRVELPDGSVLLGQALDVDRFGRLVVESSGVRRALDVGDVVHVRPV